MAQYLLVTVWSLGHMRLIWAFGVKTRQASVVLPCLQSCFEDLRALINKALPHFGDVIVMHHAFKKPPSFENRGATGVSLGHDSRIAGGVLVVSVVNGELKEVCSAKVRTLGEKVGQAWRLHVHPQESSKAACVNRKGEVKWSLHEIEVPTVEQCVKEDALYGRACYPD